MALPGCLAKTDCVHVVTKQRLSSVRWHTENQGTEGRQWAAPWRTSRGRRCSASACCVRKRTERSAWDE